MTLRDCVVFSLAEKGNPAMYQYMRIGSTFGLTTALNIWFFGVFCGGWVDEKVGTKSVFTLIGVLMGLFFSFYYLYREITIMERVKKENEEED